MTELQQVLDQIVLLRKDFTHIKQAIAEVRVKITQHDQYMCKFIDERKARRGY